MYKRIEIKQKRKEDISIILSTKEEKLDNYNLPADLRITFIKNNIEKSYKVKYNREFYIKVQKTQIQFSNVLEFIEDLQNKDTIANSIATIYLNRII